MVQAYALEVDRYGESNVGMKPLRRVLYEMIQGREGLRVSSTGRRVVRMDQALLALTQGTFTRSFSSFRTNAPTLQSTFEGALQGVGIVWHAVSGIWDAGRRRFSQQAVLGAASFSLSSMAFGGETSFQTWQRTSGCYWDSSLLLMG